MSRPWGDELVYHVFVDRFRNGRPALDVRDGEFAFHGTPVRSSKDRRDLVAARSHQWTFHNGDLHGIREAIPHLLSLGVTVLLLTPIFASRSTHRYDTDDYLRLDPHVGSDEDYRALRTELRQHGIKLVLDGVFGHTSLEHPWYRDPELRTRRYRTKADGTAETWLDWGVLPKLDTDDPETQDRLLEAIERWDADGWRLDAAQHLPAAFLRRLKERLRQLNPEAIVIAEEWEPVGAALREGLYDGVLNFQFRRHVVDFFRSEISAECLARRLSAYIEGYPRHRLRHCWNLLGNHDTERFYGAYAKDVGRMKLAIALQAFLPGTPHLYYGDEVGMRGRDAHEARAPMPWEPRRWDKAVLAAHRERLALRRANPVFAEGDFRWVHASNRTRTVAFERRSSNACALVAINMGHAAERFSHEGRQIEVPPGEDLVIFI